MIGFLVVTHGRFGSELIESAELILGKQEAYKSIGIALGDSVDELREQIVLLAKELEQGQGVVVFTDVLGGSTSTSAAMALRDQDCACITGVNLPMILEAFMGQDTDTKEELVEKCVEAGKEGILDLKKHLNEA